MKRPRISPALVISLVALSVSLGGTAWAATGGNFILGKANGATTQTGLTANFAGKTLQLANTNTAAGATPLGLVAGTGRPPFTTNSTTRVANLNADKLDGVDSTGFLAVGGKAADANLLDGLDSTQLQRSVTGTCAGGAAISAIAATGDVSCSGQHTLVHWVGTGSFPSATNLGSFTPHGGQMLVSFTASAYSQTANSTLGAYLIICLSTPCTSNSEIGVVGQAVGFTNEASSHKALVGSTALVASGTNTLYFNIHPLSGTVMDSSDWAQVSIIEFS